MTRIYFNTEKKSNNDNTNVCFELKPALTKDELRQKLAIIHGN